MLHCECTIEIAKTFKFLVHPKRLAIYQLSTEHHSCRLMVKSTLIEDDEDDDDAEGKEDRSVDHRELNPLFVGPLDDTKDKALDQKSSSTESNHNRSSSKSSRNKVTLSDPTTTTSATDATAVEEGAEKQSQSEDEV